MYAKLENKKLVYAPQNYNTGVNLILNFNKNEDLMKLHGFKKVIDIKPSYDSSTHYLSIDGYTESDNSITINYKINEIEINNTPTIEEQIADLNDVVNITMLATDEMFTMLEPLLPNEVLSTLESLRLTDKLLDMYVVMVKRGLKNEDEINEKYRSKVIEKLKEE